ncbi:MAG TPA: hypothetical protein VKX49_09255 [Bryobacteraceae bacterium]|nr:hypothetical protein [Bryobacteraceae bacterium]
MDVSTDLRDRSNVVEPRPPAPGYDDILRATRLWVLYGCGGFAVLCILIGAAEALFGR